MPIILVGTSKGGAGKSTIATNLAVMNALDGNRGALLDGDPQRSSSMWAQLREEAGIAPSVVTMERVGQAVAKTATDLADAYGTVFMDVPGNNSPGLRAAMVVADLMVYPIRPSNFDAWVFANDIEELAAHARAVNPDLRILVVMNGLNPSPAARKGEMLTIAGFLQHYSGFRVGHSYLCNRTPFNHAVREGRAVRELSGGGGSLERGQLEIESVWSEVKKCLADAYPECKASPE